VTTPSPAPAAGAPAGPRPAGAFAFPGARDVFAAAARLAGVVRRTPLERSEALSEAAGTGVWIKNEGAQRTGSFKLRGAYNRVATLTDEERSRGIVTASAGNHGMGVAYASRLLGLRPVVFVPRGTPEVKRRRIARFGGELRLVDGGYDDAHATAEAHAEATGATFVHAFSDPATVAGQGTVGLEIVEELPGVRTVVVPVGGGGLANGIGVLLRALRDASPVRLVGVQTHETAAMHASLAAGALVSPPMGPTLCEGLTGDTDLPSFLLAREVVDEIVLVSEAAVRRTIGWLYREEGIVAEGSAAVAAAALLEGAVRNLEGPVAVVLTGSNLDAARLADILGEG
jgi:threonine dehydratase